MIQSVSFCQASSIFARKCISGGESSRILTKCIGNNPHLLEQKGSSVCRFCPFYDRKCISSKKFSKHRLNLSDILGSCSNTKFPVLSVLRSNVHFRKEILKNDHFLVTFGYAVPALLRMISFCFF